MTAIRRYAAFAAAVVLLAAAVTAVALFPGYALANNGDPIELEGESPWPHGYQLRGCRTNHDVQLEVVRTAGARTFTLPAATGGTPPYTYEIRNGYEADSDWADHFTVSPAWNTSTDENDGWPHGGSWVGTSTTDRTFTITPSDENAGAAWRRLRYRVTDSTGARKDFSLCVTTQLPILFSGYWNGNEHIGLGNRSFVVNGSTPGGHGWYKYTLPKTFGASGASHAGGFGGSDRPLTFELTPDLPAGLELVPRETGGYLRGIPTEASPKQTYTWKVTGPLGSTAQVRFDLEVKGNPAVTITDLPEAHGGQPFTFTLRFNDEPVTKYRKVRDEEVHANGSTGRPYVKRAHTTPEDRNYVWLVRVTPAGDAGEATVTITVRDVIVQVPHS